MAMKRVCDRCGADINPESSASYVRLRRAYEGTTQPLEIELCCSCAMQLREWLKPRAEEGSAYPGGVTHE